VNTFKIVLVLLLLPGINFISQNEKLCAQDKGGNWKPATIFLLGGQSNMDGRGLTTELPKEFLKFPLNVRIWDGSNWVELKPGEMFGPEIGFAFEMSKKWPKIQIGLVKLGSSGTNMLVWAGKEGDAKTKQASPFGSLYIAWIQMLEKAQKSAPDAILKGVLWMQGESDAQDKDLAEKYKINLKKLIEGVRKESGIKNLPFLIGKIQAKDFKFLETVWKAQAEIAKEIPFTCLVNTDTLEEKPDKLHFTAKGQLELGRLFAEEYLKLTTKGKKEKLVVPEKENK
jgi:hypothetical protein